MDDIKKLEISNEHWIVKRWRPAMGWMYMIICVIDMLIFPILWNLGQIYQNTPITPWVPLTLSCSGTFHAAMAVVLGIAVWGRSQEKLAGVAGYITTIFDNKSENAANTK